ncbi:MAG: FapA family protein, partial [Spirochaetaceae bacterium]|nr:FapA family protein [Spirochaetaceae bacterium]
NGCDLSEERLRNELAAYGINFGIDNNTVKEIIDTPVYKKAYVVAQGTWAQDGADAYINYDFETDTSKMRFRQSTDGTMNFKEMNLIQNVVQGQPLAKKIEAEQGKPGSTVFGKLLPAKNGKDIPMPLGKNVSVADDKVTIVADLNGQVVLQASKINVEPVLTINGNVNITTGNVIFLGTVVVTGNVEDGFYVKAEGNIEIRGTVERSEIEAEGNVIVQQGVTGKETGTIKAGKSVFARFIENCQVEAGDSVVVADGLVNSNVVALKRIICNGRKAHIVGGHLKATEEINAKTIGSPSGGTETICEVGFDPSSKARLDELTTENEKANAEMEQVKLNIQTLINMRKQRKSLPEDKETQLNEMMDRREELTKMLREYRDERNRIMEFLNGLKSVGKISASERIYPGVRLIIREIEQQVKDDYKSVTFVLRNNMIQAGRYEDVSDDIKKEMETNGATTD